jgi:hypothetical protein
VGVTPCALRVNSGSSNASRSRFSDALTAGWLKNSRAAARDTLRSRISASKVRSMPMSRLRISRGFISHIQTIELPGGQRARMMPACPP